MYTDIEWQFDKYGELTIENFDATDSLIAVLGKLNMDKYQNEKFNIIESDFSNNKNIKYKIQFGDKIFDKNIEL